MTDDNSKDAAPSPKESPKAATVTADAEAPSNFAKAAQAKPAKKGGDRAVSQRRGGKGWLWLLLLVAVLGGLGSWAWYNWPQLQQTLGGKLDFLPTGRDAESQPAPVESVPAPEAVVVEAAPDRPEAAPQPGQPGLPDTEAADSAAALQQANAALRNQLQLQDNAIAQLQQQLATLQRSVTAQGSRLSELGNVSRDDWQLAEADYLLRLANQRLMLESDSRAALGLLEEVDSILRRVDLPDLYGVRQQLARDITALKLVENIDREGLYLRLAALEEQLLRVNIQPQFDLATRDPAQAEPAAQTADAPVWKRSWENFTQFMRDSVRIRDGDIDPVLLSPQSEARFRQNLRLNIEQAQLALLRGDSSVYKDALNSARQLLLEYGIAGHQRDVLLRELEELAAEPIEADLPSLTASQSALHDYIEQLHKMSASGAAAPGGDSQ
ncbi:uroporphyrinogen-III C-methyltransferase [Microbulbifer magnicolonia]|uniref:uroporphyrinogen-III C-methyltransferase n=1 Tax=Microbulbifer magnicolonia TaxID=3109744 RepID=UPI002B416CF5|nr:uroporphyrinogen-III C-methyltransferase [Microbulbifer sp. GG15]